MEGTARTRPDILKVVLGPYVQYCPFEALGGSALTVSGLQLFHVSLLHLKFVCAVSKKLFRVRNLLLSHSLRGGGGGVQAFHFGKNYFELEVGGDGQDTS